MAILFGCGEHSSSEISGFPGGSVVKNLPCIMFILQANVELIPGPGRSIGEGNVNPLQYSCLGNPMDRGAWRVTVHGITKESDTVTKEQQSFY